MTTAAYYTFGTSALPALSSTDEIQVFYLEASLPFNAGQEVVSKAGADFTAYADTHAGLGIYDITTNLKFSVEFLALNFTGALLPNAAGTNASLLTWNNAASIVVTSPLDADAWTSSRLVSITSGTAYAELVSFLQDNWGGTLYYQPVTVLSPSSSNLVAAFDSYTFVQAAITQLASYGAPLTSFAAPYISAFTYTSASSETPAIVSWSSSGGEAPTDVRNFYTALNKCYRAKAAATSGGFEYLTQIRSCYTAGKTTYVYKSPTSVYEVSLATSPVTPLLQRLPYTLPSQPGVVSQGLTAPDLAFIVILMIFITCGVTLTFKQIFCIPRSRLDYETERMADEAVGSILEGHETGRDSLHEYFYPKATGIFSSLRRWLNPNGSGSSNSGGGSYSARGSSSINNSSTYGSAGGSAPPGAGRRSGKSLQDLTPSQLAQHYKGQRGSNAAIANSISNSNPFAYYSSSSANSSGGATNTNTNPFASDEGEDDAYQSITDPLLMGESTTTSV